MALMDKRENYKPSEYSHIADPLIDAMHAGHWTVKHLSFASDVQDFATNVTPEEQGVLVRSILLTSQVEVAVKSFWGYLGRMIPKPEIAEMGAVFSGIEVIHARAYSRILDKLGLNEDFQNILNIPAVRGRIAYLNKYNDKPYTNDYKNVVYSLTLFTLFVENVSLFSQFYTILAFNRFKGGIFKDVANVVQYTSKEENLHAEGGIALINQMRIEYPDLFDEEFETRIYNEAREALGAESELVRWILDGYKSDFLSEEILTTYLKKRLNESLVRIGFNALFETDPVIENQTDWMDDEVFASTLTDFFNKRPVEYQQKMKSFNVEDLF